MRFYTSHNGDWARWRRAVAAGMVDGGGRRRLMTAEAVAGGSGWRLAAEPSPKQGKTEEGEAEQPEGEEGQAPTSFEATAASR